VSGCGKSTLAKSYADLYPRREEDDRTVIPVLYVELPGQPTAKVFAESMLNSMGASYAERGGAEEKLERIRKLLVECRVELVILDEMQHVVDNLDSRSRDITADTFKNLMNRSCVPHVFVGGPTCRGYFVQNQQLGRRCTPKVHLRPFGIASTGESLDFQRLLKALAMRLPFSKSSALLDTAMVEPLWFASFGLIGQLTQLVKAALEIALESGAETLSRGHLSRAFAETIYMGCPKRRNPFEAGFNRQPLINEGEPFHGFIG
jgi:type II secretory pathway predicted ATPase ExeA